MIIQLRVKKEIGQKWHLQSLWIHSVATKVASIMNLKTLPQKLKRVNFSGKTLVVNSKSVSINRVLNTYGMYGRKSLFYSVSF